MRKRIVSFVAVFIILMQMTVSAEDFRIVFTETIQYIYDSTPNSTVSSIGGEWAVMGAARSDTDVGNDIYDTYYKNIETILKKNNGVLHERKYTEYSRAVIALTAIGENPQDVAGYNLLLPLADYEKTVWQGINGSIWALIALDCGGYEIPLNNDAQIQATRQMYVDNIIKLQMQNGGWSLSEGGEADTDVTAMALAALSDYREQPEVKEAVNKATDYLSDIQNENGGFVSYEGENSETDAQVIVALCELGISMEDERFVKNSKTVLDSLMSYYNNNGSFSHIKNGESSQMATEQALCAMVAVDRMKNGKNTLYDMSDAENKKIEDKQKNHIVKVQNVIYPNKTFDDIKNNISREKIEELSSRGIINGRSENEFAPDETMTRAEFATIVVKSLGLDIKKEKCFYDVLESDWYFEYVSTAHSVGIVKGVSEAEFNPNGIITKEQAAVMVSKAAELCGMSMNYNETAIRNILAGFTDYMKSSEWAKESLAFCYDVAILNSMDIEIQPQKYVIRAEIAEMLYNLLDIADLL